MAAPTLITFVAGEAALAEDVNANFDAIAGKFNGGIMDSDISSSAKIKGYKLSTASGEQVPEGCLGNNAVSARVLQSDVSAGHALAAVATGDHIKDGIITTEKMALGAGRLLVHTQPIGISTTTLLAAGLFVGEELEVQSTYPKANWKLVSAHLLNMVTASGTIYATGFHVVDDAVPYATVRAWVLGSSYGAGTTGTLVMVFQAL